MGEESVLITGGAGFIGSALCLKLIDLGFKVTIYDNLLPQIHGDSVMSSYTYNLIKNKVRIVEGDVRDKEKFSKTILKGWDYIIHLAAETGTGQSMYEISRYTDVNCSGTAILLESVKRLHIKPKRLVLSSSRAVYGEGKYVNSSTGKIVYPQSRDIKDLEEARFDIYDGEENCLTPLATDESTPFSPTSIYGVTKAAQESLFLTACKAYSIPAVALRFQNVYGPGQSLKNPYTGILSIFSNLLLLNKEVNIFEDGAESRDFVYISDVVESLILAMNVDIKTSNIFNIGSGVQTTVLEVANELRKAYDRGNVGIRISGDYRIGDIRHNFADLDKSKNELGFTPKVNFENGIKEFAKWVLKMGPGFADNTFKNSIGEIQSHFSS